MLGSVVLYAGVIVVGLGLALSIRPVARIGIATRRRALGLSAVGLLVAVGAILIPVSELRATSRATRLDAFAPVWQFAELHTRRIAAPPARVYEAIKQVRADEIALFNTLTWIRRGGQALPAGVLNPGAAEPLLDAAVRGGFIWLADEPPNELVVGTVVMAPPGTRGTLTPDVFARQLPAGFALATMNFAVVPDAGGSMVTTETRVFANDPWTARRFAAYWRVIYPGSALIRRMWLRAIERRAQADS